MSLQEDLARYLREEEQRKTQMGNLPKDAPIEDITQQHQNNLI